MWSEEYRAEFFKKTKGRSIADLKAVHASMQSKYERHEEYYDEGGNPARCVVFLLRESDAKLGSVDQARFTVDRRSQGRGEYHRGSMRLHRSRGHELHRLHQPNQHNTTTTTTTTTTITTTTTTT
jgi:hypothetical protein